MSTRSLTMRAEGASTRVRLAGFLLIVGLAAGPIATHVYWMLGGVRGLHQETTTGIRIVAAVVLVLLIAAVLVVLARSGCGSRRWSPTA